MNVKEQIIGTLRSTGRENIENVIAYMEKKGFFMVGCCHHHQYQGGLADHAWQAYQYALKLEEENRILRPLAPALDQSSLALCALLHDFCDCFGMHDVHAHRHGLRSARMLQKLGVHLSSDEFLAIRFHMSLRRHKDHPLYEKACHCHLRYIVHTADGLSAKTQSGSEIK